MPNLDVNDTLHRLEAREREGSTFLNEGVALPHARVPGLDEPQAALGITRAGILDAPTEQPIHEVFLLLSPEARASSHLQALASAGRALRNRDLRQLLAEAATSEDVLVALKSQEGATGRSRIRP